MISHLIAVFIGAAFVGAPVGIAVMAWIYAGREIKQPEIITVHHTPIYYRGAVEQEPEAIDWSVIGV